uniref:Uncharacterized protein n=1 Tax=Tanacetum cinerariifolium TaxID=118510 RepID=A0A699HPG0_TANCI|nr:hypothetical protein [Tanacetum cinerariifolium]
MFIQGQIDQGVESTVPVESHHTPTNAPSTSQPPTSTPSMQTTHDAEEPATMPHDSPLPRVQSLGSTKLTYGAAYTKLILRVKKLEHKVKTSQHRRRARVVLSDDEKDFEDPSKQGRKITEIDENPFISLVQVEGTLWIQEDFEIQVRTSADTEILLDQEEPTKLVEDLDSNEKGKKEISTVIPEKKSKKKLEQERLRHKDAIRLQEQIFEEERQRISRDAEIAKQLQEAITEADSAHDIDWNDPVNRGGYKQSYFKRISYEDIRPIFERVWDQIHAFVPMDSEIEKEVMKKSGFDLQQNQFAEEISEKKDDNSSKPVGGSRKKTGAKKRIGAKLDEESAKRQKLKDVTEEEATAEYENEKEELRLSLKIIHNDDSEVKYELLSKKIPIDDLLLWGDLRMIFDPDENDELWMNQLDWKFLR